VTLIQATPSIGNLLQLLNAPNWETLPVTKNGMCTVG
jgi:hypothetical protein